MFNLCYCVYKQEVELDKQNLAAAFPKDWMEFKFFFQALLSGCNSNFLISTPSSFPWDFPGLSSCIFSSCIFFTLCQAPYFGCL